MTLHTKRIARINKRRHRLGKKPLSKPKSKPFDPTVNYFEVLKHTFFSGLTMEYKWPTVQ